MKKLVAILLAALLLVTAGCQSSGGSNSGSSSSKAPANSSEQTAPTGEPVVLDWVFTKAGFDASPEPHVILQAIEEATGVRLNQISPPMASYGEQIAVLMASTDLPDVIKLNTIASMVDYAEQGALRPLDDLMDQMPSVVASVSEKAFTTCSFNGSIYAVPCITSSHRLNVAYRKDWLDKLGLKVPETLDDFHDMLYAFTYNDPDGDGEQNTYGISGAAGGSSVGSTSWPFEMVTGAYGVVGACNGYFYVGDDGNLHPQATNPSVKDALEVLNQWYQEGIIDPEFIVMSGSEMQQRAYANAFGVVLTWWTGAQSYENNMIKLDPTVDWADMGGPKGPDGTSALRGVNEVDYPVCVLYNCEHPEAFAKVTEYCHTEIGMMTTYSGIEGVHWEKRSDGTYHTLPEFDNCSNWIQFHALYQNEWPLLQVQTYLLEGRLDSQKWDIITNAADGYVTESEVKYSADLNSMVLQTYCKMVTGEIPVDNFESFCQEYLNNGGQEWADEVTTIYKSRNS